MATNHLRRKLVAFAGIAASAALVLSGCSSADSGGDSNGGAADGPEKITVGVSQFVQAPPLDAAVEGFQQAFIDAGYVDGETIEFVVNNANAEVPTASTIAQAFAQDQPDLVLAVATPSAQAAVQNIVDIPVLFTAVTDPVAADIVDTAEAPGSNVTGTSDMNPVDDQIGLIQEILPDAAKIGVVYGSGEVNAEVQVALAREAAEARGIELVEQTVTNANELKQATEALGDVDAIYTPSDNLVISGLGSIIAVAEERGILVVGADSEHVAGGAVATVGIDYYKLGYQTGEMALRVLEGEDTATMPVETSSDLSLSVSLEAAERLGVTVPQGLIDRAENVIE